MTNRFYHDCDQILINCEPTCLIIKIPVEKRGFGFDPDTFENCQLPPWILLNGILIQSGLAGESGGTTHSEYNTITRFVFKRNVCFLICI